MNTHVTGESNRAAAMKREAQQRAEQVEHKLANATDEYLPTVAKHISAVGRAFREAGEHLDRDGEALGPYATKLGERVESASSYLTERTAGDIQADISRLARRDPMIFVGGAALIGFLAGRFLRAASPGSDEEWSHDGELGYERQRPMSELGVGTVPRPTPRPPIQGQGQAPIQGQGQAPIQGQGQAPTQGQGLGFSASEPPLTGDSNKVDADRGGF